MTGAAGRGDPRAEARLIAQRFHEQYQRVRRRDGSDMTDWADMPESYHRRLLATFEQMLRAGMIAPGPVIGFHDLHDD